VELPDQDGASDVMKASLFLVASGGSLLLEGFDGITHHSAAIPNTVILLGAGYMVVDWVLQRGLVKSIQSGLTRIFVDDLIRRCRTEAAAFLLAYLLGIPMLCYRPNLEAIRAVAELVDESNIDNYLVWSLAGPACEASIDGILMETDLNAAGSFIDSLSPEVRERAGTVRGVQSTVVVRSMNKGAQSTCSPLKQAQV